MKNRNKDLTPHTDGSFLDVKGDGRIIMVHFTKQEIEGILNVLGPGKSLSGWIHAVVVNHIEELGALVDNQGE